MERTPEQVARAHLDAVVSGDPVAMAADYADHAVLERAGDRHAGRAAIERYFRSVPARLGQARVVFDDLQIEGERARFRWHLEGGAAAAAGEDVCTIRGGAIVHQVVHLDSDDF